MEAREDTTRGFRAHHRRIVRSGMCFALCRVFDNHQHIRYGNVRVTGKDITPMWDKEEGSFTVSGPYGP